MAEKVLVCENGMGVNELQCICCMFSNDIKTQYDFKQYLTLLECII